MHSRLPRLGVVFDPLSVPPRELMRASRGICDVVLLPVEDRISPEMAEQLSLFVEVAPIVSAHQLRLAAVTTFSEYTVERTAALADELGLPGASSATARSMLSKSMQRQLLRAAGLDNTAHHRLASMADLEIVAGGALDLPLILKPDRGVGSWDVTLVRDREQLLHEGRRVVETGAPYVAERYLEPDPSAAGTDWGPYCSVEMISRGRDHTPVAVVGRGPLGPGFRETGNVYPSTLDEQTEVEVTELVVAALTALGDIYGSTHTEVMLTPAGPRLIEINGRLGGGIAPLLRHATGFDLVQATMHAAVGVYPPALPPKPQHVSAWVVLYPDAEFVKRVAFERLKESIMRDRAVVSVTAHERYARSMPLEGSARPASRLPVEPHSVEVIVTAPDHARLAISVGRILDTEKNELLGP